MLRFANYIWLHKLPTNADIRRERLESSSYRSLGISEMVKLLVQNPGCDLDGDIPRQSGASVLPFYIDTATIATEQAYQKFMNAVARNSQAL